MEGALCSSDSKRLDVDAGGSQGCECRTVPGSETQAQSRVSRAQSGDGTKPGRSSCGVSEGDVGLPVLPVHRVLSSAQGTGSGELRCLGCSISQVQEPNTTVRGPCFERLQVLDPVPPSRGVETFPHDPPCRTEGVPCIQGRSVACQGAFPRDTGQRGESTIHGGSLRLRNSGPRGPRTAAAFWGCMRYSYGNANPLCSPDSLLQLL